MSSIEPRVRFAPSPTGRLHVGGARTALFNWLFARRQKGTMVLRVEDTDAERSTRESEASLLEDLHWLGLEWDEGPDVGGAYGPYRQSERRALYAEQAEKLVDGGHAYACFCSDYQLKLKREAQLAAGVDPHYDGTCRDLDADECNERRRTGEAHTIRFRLPAGTLKFEDFLRGSMRIESSTLGDFVLLRSNGLPTYNFACVVDDAGMNITHVLRGEDHLYNTSRQVALYDALKYARPVFVHLSLILGEDRSKLKKREGKEGTFVDDYRRHGYLPEALVNFLALLGWSSESGEEVFQPSELIAQFDLSRVSKSPAVFDTQKLRWMSGEHLRAADPGKLVSVARPFLQEAGLANDTDSIDRWLRAFRDRITALDELPSKVEEVLHPGEPELAAAESLQQESAAQVLTLLANKLEDRLQKEGQVDGPTFKELLKQSGKETGVKGKALFMPARAAISGRVHGPDLPLLFESLPTEEVIRRLIAAAGV